MSASDRYIPWWLPADHPARSAPAAAAPEAPTPVQAAPAVTFAETVPASDRQAFMEAINATPEA